MTLLSRRALILGSFATLAVSAAGSAAPRRIVSVGGAITETLYRLGLESEIVGVDSTSQFPTEALRTKANVGYIRALGAEGVLSLNPSLILAAEGAGPPDAIRLIGQAGVPIVHVTDAASEKGVVQKVETVAKALGAEERGARLSEEIERGFAELSLARAKISRPTRALFVLSLQNGRPLVGGRGTTADAMLRLAGAENVAASLEGWKPLSDEGLIAAAPEAVVMMDRGPGGAAADPFTYPAFAATPAAAQRRLVVMDALYLLGFGPRTPSAAKDLMTLLHPPAGVRAGTTSQP